MALQFEGVDKSYGEHLVLKQISFQVYEHEFVGLVGVNGAGKTTLIKSLLDFISVNSGEIKIFGKSHRQTMAREPLAFLPEKFIPPFYLSGMNFLSYMAELNNIEIKEEEIVEIFRLLDLDMSAINKSVRQYSKGMAQKLGLAACFLSQRPLLLFDEPMSGLDPKARAYLKKHLLNLKEEGKTLFFSTHLLSDVESLCDRIIVLHEGEIRFNGSPAECCDVYNKDSLEEAYLACINEQAENQTSL